MSVIYKNVNNIKIGYLGTLVFLDNQETFSGMFGDKPTIIAQNIDTSQDSASTSKSLYSFGEKCKLDVLLHTLGKYYVGHNSIDNSLAFKMFVIRFQNSSKNGKIKIGYSCEASLTKCLISFCRYQAAFQKVREHGLSNCFQHTSQPYLRNWWIEYFPNVCNNTSNLHFSPNEYKLWDVDAESCDVLLHTLGKYSIHQFLR